MLAVAPDQNSAFGICFSGCAAHPAGCCVFRRREKATGTALTTRNWRLSTVRGQQYEAKTNWSSVVELNVEPEASEVGALPPSRKISAENHAAAALGLPPRQLSRKFSDAI